MGRFSLSRCAASGCDSYTTGRFCNDCSGRKVLVPSVVRQCSHPGCRDQTNGDVLCVVHCD